MMVRFGRRPNPMVVHWFNQLSLTSFHTQLQIYMTQSLSLLLSHCLVQPISKTQTHQLPLPQFHQFNQTPISKPSSSLRMSSYAVESSTVETSDGVKLHARLFKPREDDEIKDNLVVVLVHPFSILGGCQALLKGIAVGLAGNGYRAVTFDMRGAGRSSGRASLTGFAEIKDVIAVCKWVCDNLDTNRILLVGSSAGAPIAGSSVDEIPEVVGYVSLGYPFGMAASILFGRHHKAILHSPKPKLFVMGTKDGFTSVKQLQNKLSSASGRVETHLIEGVSHFQMEGPAYDTEMVNLILTFIASL